MWFYYQPILLTLVYPKMSILPSFWGMFSLVLLNLKIIVCCYLALIVIKNQFLLFPLFSFTYCNCLFVCLFCLVLAAFKIFEYLFFTNLTMLYLSGFLCIYLLGHLVKLFQSIWKFLYIIFWPILSILSGTPTASMLNYLMLPHRPQVPCSYIF